MRTDYIFKEEREAKESDRENHQHAHRSLFKNSYPIHSLRVLAEEFQIKSLSNLSSVTKRNLIYLFFK